MSLFKRSKKWSSIAVVDDILDQGMIITSSGYDALIDQITEALQNVEPFELTEEPEHVVSMAMRPQSETGQQQYITVIPINGPLVRKSTWFTSYMGLSSYMGISIALQTALKDVKCIGIMFDIDSPGGQASGLFDLVDLIYESRDIKPIIGLSNASAYSAAYAIASATKELYVVRDGGVGSVGVIMRHFDYSGMLKMDGIEVTSIFAGKRKDDFSPYKPLSKKALQRAQDMVNETYNQFANVVSRNMGITVAKVKATEADIFFGADAVKQKLAKGVLSYEAAVNRAINESGDSTRSGSSGGSLEKDANTGLEVTLSVIEEAEFIPQELYQSIEKTLRKENDVMNKAEMIKALINDVKYPFTDANQEWLESQNEAFLNELMKTAAPASISEEDRASIRTEVELEIRTETNGVVQVLEDRVTSLTQETTDLRQAVEVESDARMRAEFGIFITDNNVPGNAPDIVESMLTLKKADAGAFEVLQNSLIAAGAAVAGLFDEHGSKLEGEVPENAHIALQEKKMELMKNDPSLTEPKAWVKAVKDNPELYQQYQKDQKRKNK